MAGAGMFAFVVACFVPLLEPASVAEVQSISVAEAFAGAPAAPAAVMVERVRDVARAPDILGVQVAPVAIDEPTPEPVATAVPTAVPTLAPTPAPVVPTLPPLPPPPLGGVVIASWYGPGFYGNRTACGQTYTPEIVGVAHRTLPCGTLVVLEYRGRTLTVPVIDRGPYIAGRTLDLSNATHIAMGCPDLCTLSMRIAQ